MEKYLKDRQYYIDLYDQGTVEQCRRWVKYFSKPLTDTANDVRKLKHDWSLITRDVSLYCIQGERFADKSETINKWMARDKKRDDLLENSQPIPGVRCLACHSPMEIKDKSLETDLNDNDRVMFFYSCPGCKKARFFFDDGKEHIPKVAKCPKCGIELKSKSKDEKDKLILVEFCNKCDYKDESVINLGHKEKFDPDYEKDRNKYCLSDEDGQKFISMKISMEGVEFLKEKSEKETELAKKIKHIKKLNITELEELLSKELLKNSFKNFETSNPEIGKSILVSFTIHDTDKERREYDSINVLKKTISTTLKNTNWQLSNDGINCRLGILSGRLRGSDE